MTENPSPLVGQAIGDSLGMPFETQPANSPELLAWDGSYLPSEYHNLRPGQWTDDTMMARMIAESLISRNGYYPPDVSKRYVEWFCSGDHRGMGKTTRTALDKLNQGASWAESGIQGAEGNGTAMRAAPIGFFYKEDLPTVREFARLDAKVTHRSHEAEMGSVAVAIGVALLARGKADKTNLVSQVIPWLEGSRIKTCFSYMFSFFEGLFVKDALRRTGTKAHVVETVPAAFAAFTLTSSYVEAVEAAIRAGGDTDTTAAITGALAGTYYGLEGIPERYTHDLEIFDTLRDIDLQLTKGLWTGSGYHLG